MSYSYYLLCHLSSIIFVPNSGISNCLFKLKVIYCVGGVISPLLANIYLHVLDTVWKTRRVQERFEARLIRYVDDFVVLCKGDTGRLLKGVQRVLGDLGLTLNLGKTRTVDARKESFHFLGYTVIMRKSPRTGWMFPLIRPSRKAQKRIKGEIKSLTSRRNLALPKEVVIKKLNEAVRGWAGYFYYGNCSKDFSALKEFLEGRVRIYLKRKHRKKGRGYKAYPSKYLYEALKLYRIPTTAPWTQAVKAAGRR
jgi:RNA-directed DNA polymerase